MYCKTQVNVVLNNQKIGISAQSHAYRKKTPYPKSVPFIFKSKNFEFALYEQWLVFALLWR